MNIVVNRLAARTIDQADFKEKLKKGDDSLEDMVNVLIEHNCIAEWDVFEDVEFYGLLKCDELPNHIGVSVLHNTVLGQSAKEAV